ncbi:MAG: hypothetical protein GY943_05915 [Chloroflexi bacterium]|nr:hypothetical protein [Chloroflexota bacterium]
MPYGIYAQIKISPAQSHQEPLVQVANLFVGIGSYSRARYEKIAAWQQQNNGQLSLLPTADIRTLNPQNPLNFWWYMPQNSNDKAPTRK